MIATLTSISPGTARPGATLTLTGANFAAGAVVLFTAGERTRQDAAPAIASATSMTAVLPDVLDGMAGSVLVSVANAGEAESERKTLYVLAYPEIASTYPLCPLALLKEVLGVPAEQNADDQRFRRAIEAASAAFTRFCRRTFHSVEITGEHYDGDGSATLWLRETPVLSVAALEIDGQAVAAGEYAVYADYIRLKGGDGQWNARLRSDERIFPRGWQNVRVNYTAGYTSVPGDVAYAVAQQAAFLLNVTSKQGVLSETNAVSQNTTSWQMADLCPLAKAAALRYRKTTVAVI